ncbi:LamG-like jellyroll fold domain-containing protein [Natranaeroarchaeum aerophilus]|uniref:LamG-like jellyroll fold domain-containing protein n=1 Tax=Natranaeroarchaeum aerophilus TaxID=2917711 RepID=A0AAE3FPZ4_9EURY|nr:LamG-like jellyroll fold domain-containing protein [Natranaeroarchaeum aerophilus]MCL9813021.1 hypothetical protein [Natranaeroarchaeum aerophilus]
MNDNLRESGFGVDTRGQAIQIGALLLFAALIVAAAGYQAGIVPDQNSEIEFNHNQQVHGEMVELRNAMLVASDRQSTQTRRVTLGTRYPERTLFVNPPPASGSLRTSDRQEIRFENADSTGATTFTTRSIEYRPRYYEYRSAPTTVIEHGAVYNDHGTRVLAMTDTALIENGEISLVLVDGELSLAGDRVRQVSVDAASARSRTVPIQSADGDEFTLELPTRLSEEDWADTGALDGHDFEVTDGVLRVTLDGERSYDLTIARLGFGGDIEPAEPAYLTEVEGEDDVTVELRDEYNAPIEGETVTLSVADGDGRLESGDATGTETDLVTNREGQVSARYVPGDGETGTVTVEAFHESDSVGSVTIEFDVAGSTGSGESRPGSGAVVWNEDDPTVADADSEFSLEATNSRGDTLANFAVSDRDVVQIVDAPESFTDGTAEPTFEIDGDAASASGRDSWYAYVFDRSSGDRLTLQLPDTVGVVWETLEDWADADEQDGVVHETFGDRQDDAIQLGYEGTDDGLVGYWPLDEEDDTVAEDVSGTDNDGDHADSPVIGADGLLETTSYEFDGESGHVEVPHDESLEMSDGDTVTVSTWANQASDQSGEEWVALVQKSDTSFNLQLANGNEPTFTIHDGGWNEANSGIELETDQWYHLTGIYDGDEARIYVDGELEGTTTVDGEMTDASEFGVGIGENLDASGRHLDGRMDEVRLYDRALTETEVTSLEDIRTGSYTSGERTATEPLDLETLELTGVDVTTNDGDALVQVEAVSDDGSTATSDPIPLDGGIESYTVEGLTGEADSFRLLVEMGTPTVERSPVLSRVELSGDSLADDPEPVRVNFQPPDAEFSGETPEGYLADVGEAFGDHDADVDYGWIDGPVEEYRERGSVDDVRYDTLAHMNWDSADEESWAVAMPDGTYDVTLVMGDPDHTDSEHTVTVEDTTFVDEEGEGGSNFVTHQGTVEVTDEQLRIDSAGLGYNQKLAFVEVTPAADPGLIDDFEYPTSVLDDQYRVNYDGSPTNSHSTADGQLVLGDSSRLYSAPGLGGPEPYAERDLNYYPEQDDQITATTTLGQEDVVTTFNFGVDSDEPIRGYTVKLDPTSEDPGNDATVQLYSEDGDFENYPNLDDQEIDLDAGTEYEIVVDWGEDTVQLRLFEVNGEELTDEPLRVDSIDEFDSYRGIAVQNRYLDDPNDGETVWEEIRSDING